MSEVDHRSVTVPAHLAGARLDRVLVEQVEGWSRSRLQQVIKAGLVQVGGECVRRAGTPVAAGDTIDVELPETRRAALDVTGRPIVELPVVYEDEVLAVIDKPAGIVAHPNARQQGGTVADLARARYGDLPEVQGEDRPGIVHRLDRLTSGLMVLGRERAAMKSLKDQFRARTVEKVYLAIVHGTPRFDSEWIEGAIAPDARSPDRFRVVPPHLASELEARAAETFVETLERFAGFAFVACHPKSGRTHQLRVHLLHVGCPIVGDRIYRHPGALPVPLPPEAPKMERQALHAHKLAFTHPVSGERMQFEAPLPADMQTLLAWMREHASQAD